MKILFLAPVDLSRGGGPAAHVRRLCEALERRGHVVRLIAHRPAGDLAWAGPAGGFELAGGTAVLRVPRLRHFASEGLLARALRREIRGFRPDLLLLRQEALTISPWLAGLVTRRRSVPLVVESNSSLPAVAVSAGAPAARVSILATWEGKLLRAADAVGVVTAALASRHACDYHLETGRLFVVPNGAWLPPLLGAEAAGLRRARRVDPGEFVVAFAGNMNAPQGLEVLLEVLARPDLPEVRGWIIGDAAERPRWQALARSLGARADFLGALSEEDACRYLQAAQVVVAPYHADDYARIVGEDYFGASCRCAPYGTDDRGRNVGGPSSLKVLTALACDRPLLMSDAPGLDHARELASVEPVMAGDAGAWAAAIRRQATAWEGEGRPLRDWPWREGQGPGRQFIAAGHTWDHTAAAWEAAFARAISGSGRRPR